MEALITQLKVLVVDDERLARERLTRILERMQGVVCVGEAENGQVALARIATLEPDLLLLDVEMPGLDGLALARTAGIPPIVFTTAHVHRAADAFDLEAVDFLLKPVREERLARAIERVRRRMASSAGASPARQLGECDRSLASLGRAAQLAVHAGGTIRFVDPTRVAVFHARDKYTEFELDGAELLLRESLDALEVRLGAAFVRVHRSALVRRDAIVGLEQKGGVLAARLMDGTRVLASRRLAPNLRRALGVRK